MVFGGAAAALPAECYGETDWRDWSELSRSSVSPDLLGGIFGTRVSVLFGLLFSEAYALFA